MPKCGWDNSKTQQTERSSSQDTQTPALRTCGSKGMVLPTRCPLATKSAPPNGYLIDDIISPKPQGLDITVVSPTLNPMFETKGSAPMWALQQAETTKTLHLRGTMHSIELSPTRSRTHPIAFDIYGSIGPSAEKVLTHYSNSFLRKRGRLQTPKDEQYWLSYPRLYFSSPRLLSIVAN